ncbi:Nascent polypeptide-associated complex subunit beta [Tilletia horrida]|uniref:Nascent polypeptide-associated complex subunit beta n=1 Tax=Tilletia horrida TaxID=155126 RepID=A0AAN6GT68_9BASI|nr:Nascent polypeptide-associated complex subunit beta [Tilletia horrida]KAK0556205.1 Nascent polypeptide-associated complex subunit beta [Tilletia horrida]KAK0569132.1 Nascent polypeptide-associated complex subunit beta [Tilletia horrida]
MPVNPEALARLQAASRVGGKGTPRRKVVKKKGPGGDDVKLQAALKKLNVQPLSGIEEVNMFKDDGNVLHFQAPKVHGVSSANTHAIYGRGVDKELTDLVPNIISQLGADSLASLRKLAESYSAMNAHAAAQASAGGKDDDDVPDVVGDFDVEEGKESAPAAEADVDKLD